jgi:hypothetical protein
MTKSKLVNALEQGGVVSVVSVKNLQDLALQHASALDKVKGLAIWALDNIKGFPDKVSAEDTEQLQLGYRHKYSLANPAVEYAIVEGNYLKVSDCAIQGIEIPKNAERVSYGVDFAFSFNPNEVGRLKDTHGDFIYNLLAGKDGIRTKCNKYVSNTLGKLLSAGKVEDDIRKGIKVERKPNLDFADWLYSEKGPIKTMKQRAVNQEAKKIITKDDVKRLESAIIAFNVAWKKV